MYITDFLALKPFQPSKKKKKKNRTQHLFSQILCMVGQDRAILETGGHEVCENESVIDETAWVVDGGHSDGDTGTKKHREKTDR